MPSRKRPVASWAALRGMLSAGRGGSCRVMEESQVGGGRLFLSERQEAMSTN